MPTILVLVRVRLRVGDDKLCYTTLFEKVDCGSSYPIVAAGVKRGRQVSREPTRTLRSTVKMSQLRSGVADRGARSGLALHLERPWPNRQVSRRLLAAATKWLFLRADALACRQLPGFHHWLCVSVILEVVISSGSVNETLVKA